MRARHFGGKQSPEDPAFLGDALRPYPDLGRGAEPLGNLSEGCPPGIAGKLTYRDCIPQRRPAASYARGPGDRPAAARG